jgi:LmbE family N-acetylglucosaminyl deacetylase
MTERRLRAITDPARPQLPGRTVLVFAHPDDETLACGALLPRLDDVTLVHVTDGAPRNGEDARRRGFASPPEYAGARRAELRAALALAGIGEDRLVGFDVADQGAAFALPAIARRLAPMLQTADLVVTHAYEGGHPDHDAVCWAVHAALGLLGEPGLGGAGRPALIEVPLYRLAPDGGWLRQTFGSDDAALLRLAPAERDLKARMIAAHASQAGTLSGFGIADEAYRAAPAYDFAQLPNGGALLYERYGWGLTGARWIDLAAAAARELRPERAA